MSFHYSPSSLLLLFPSFSFPPSLSTLFLLSSTLLLLSFYFPLIYQKCPIRVPETYKNSIQNKLSLVSTLSDQLMAATECTAVSPHSPENFPSFTPSSLNQSNTSSNNNNNLQNNLTNNINNNINNNYTLNSLPSGGLLTTSTGVSTTTNTPYTLNPTPSTTSLSLHSPTHVSLSVPSNDTDGSNRSADTTINTSKRNHMQKLISSKFTVRKFYKGGSFMIINKFVMS